MQPANVPLTGRRYWWAISAASIFGVNLGDYIAHDLHMGHWQALPVLLILFLAVLLIERHTLGNELWYWLAVLLGRTAATNLADLATHDWKLEYDVVTLVLVPALITVVALGRARAPMSPATAAVQPAPPRSIANPAYWLALLIAEVIGTELGDSLADVFDLTHREEFLLLYALTVSRFALRTDRRFQGPVFYWVTILVIATVGLSVGDYIAHTGRLCPPTCPASRSCSRPRPPPAPAAGEPSSRSAPTPRSGWT